MIRLFVCSSIFISSIAFSKDRIEYENMLWDSVLSADTKEMYKTYIKEYPKGHYIRIAKIRFKQLGGIFGKKKNKVATRNLSKNKNLSIDEQLVKCNNHIKAKRLTSGKGGNALACYNKVLGKQPNNIDALEGINNIGKKYLSWAKAYLKKGKVEKALKYYIKAEKISPNLEELSTYKALLDAKMNAKDG